VPSHHKDCSIIIKKDQRALRTWKKKSGAKREKRTRCSNQKTDFFSEKKKDSELCAQKEISKRGVRKKELLRGSIKKKKKLEAILLVGGGSSADPA